MAPRNANRLARFVASFKLVPNCLPQTESRSWMYGSANVSADLIRGQHAITCVVIGAAGALIFLFAFPTGSITTLMHEVLHLPGPGAGIAIILGPFLTLVAICSFDRRRGIGGAVVASMAFGVAYMLLVWLIEIPTNSKGAFGSASFLAAVALFGIVTEGMMVIGKRAKTAWRCALAGAVANAAVLAFYWSVIFPRTAGWIDPGDIPLLLAVCLVCGFASGLVACWISTSVSRVFGLDGKE